jgi:2-oxo-4-hydroxy-4-carboxy--5-ureidoimidazoline (OHCU) decarboxylase
MATKKKELSAFRNLSKGKLMAQQKAINTMLTSLPAGVKALSDDEKEIFSRLRECYRDILGTWGYRSKELLNNL